MKFFINLIGWLGTILIISAYILVSFNIITAQSFSYQILNIIGACGIAISSFAKKDMQPVILNIFWALVALISLITLL